MTTSVQSSDDGPDALVARLKMLTAAQVMRIDELLGDVGECDYSAA